MVAIIGENSGTELSDFLVPFSILSESGAADVAALSSRPGPVETFTDLGAPGFRFLAQSTLDAFDASHPEGADYVVVPAMRETPEALRWLKRQAEAGATLVSICNGALIVADTGLMKDRRATAHWSTESHRLEHHADIRWVKNARYVADGNWVSSAGVSAALPLSIALVEAMAGRASAASLAARLGLADWSAKHDSDAFHPRLGVNAWALAEVVYANRWLHEADAFSLPLSAGLDEAALALTADAYSSTGRSRAYLVAASPAPLSTRHGLTVLPDPPARQAAAAALPALQVGAAQPGKALDGALADIAARYGRSTAFGVAQVFEYPNFKD
ncbi:AraC family transcriptional regulator [Chromobacterium alticapitis]|uniref:AraC family transcriptional regulator n=1 Tax=Chromobacterium alticapitis TaxID=2073169 RepID=A0A2S5DFV2_9NEIS|nr:AraC family transcriptional regulator [Chromobacterium alticapitis]